MVCPVFFGFGIRATTFLSPADHTAAGSSENWAFLA